MELQGNKLAKNQRPAHQPGWFDDNGGQHLDDFDGVFGVFGVFGQSWRQGHTLQRSGPHQDGPRLLPSGETGSWLMVLDIDLCSS